MAAKLSPASEGGYKSYTIGFALSILLTILPFFMVINDLVNGWALVAWLIGFALAQLVVQLLFFLHLGSERSPHWNLIVLVFAVLTVITVVIGSLWIMHNLDYNMTPHEADEYIFEEEGIGR